MSEPFRNQERLKSAYEALLAAREKLQDDLPICSHDVIKGRHDVISTQIDVIDKVLTALRPWNYDLE